MTVSATVAWTLPLQAVGSRNSGDSYVLNQDNGQKRRQDDRRDRQDRRIQIDRRLEERRLDGMPVEFERRSGLERRVPSDRRYLNRRTGSERRGLTPHRLN